MAGDCAGFVPEAVVRLLQPSSGRLACVNGHRCKRCRRGLPSPLQTGLYLSMALCPQDVQQHFKAPAQLAGKARTSCREVSRDRTCPLRVNAAPRSAIGVRMS